MSEIGSFGGMFSARFNDARDPVLVASCTASARNSKSLSPPAFTTPSATIWSRIAWTTSWCKARVRSFFLDYIATGKLEPEVVAQIVEGLARACSEANCALLGGETAEMPGFYSEGEYDVAGFIVGLVDRSKVIDGSRITAGDVVIGLPSVGLHTNGYVWRASCLLETAGYQVDTHVPELGCTSGKKLLKPHKNYLPRLPT